MKFISLLLSAQMIAAVYPLIFWIPAEESYRQRTRKFNITLPNLLGGFVLVSVWLISIPLLLKVTVTIWKMSLLAVSSYSWKKQYPNPMLMTIPSIVGVYTYFCLYNYFKTASGALF